jgi:hypothetical protein
MVGWNGPLSPFVKWVQSCVAARIDEVNGCHGPFTIKTQTKLSRFMQHRLHTSPPLSEPANPFLDLLIRVQYEQRPRAVRGRSHCDTGRADLTQPVIDLNVVTTAKTGIVMVDDRAPSTGQCLDLRQGHLLTRLGPALSLIVVVDDAIVRVCEHQVTR